MHNSTLISRKKLEIALSLIQKDENGYFLTGHFYDLTNIVRYNLITKRTYFKENELKMLKEINENLIMILERMWNIETIILRLNKQKKQWTQGKLTDIEWIYFAALDIKYFHVEIRSIFDYLARIIKEVSDSPKQLPDSFSKLKTNLYKKKYNEKLGDNLTHLINSCDWFFDIRRIRDLVIHKKELTFICLVKNQIVFQIHDRSKPSPQGIQIVKPEVLSNPYTVDFEKYAAIYTSFLIDYLEESSQLISKRLNMPQNELRAKAYHPGLEVLRNWIKNLSESMQKKQAGNS